mgnify:FL=1
MADIMWLIRRLKAMSVPEVTWRVSQKLLQKKEKKKFEPHKLAVTKTLFNKNLKDLHMNADKMHLNLENKEFSLNRTIPLLGGYDYEVYRKQWDAGFQTNNNWPKKFSYSLEYKQRDDIGDARTNWELNRHFQFALLAKDYYVSKDIKFLNEFQELFENWNNENPFLYGISWTSVMEVAIRVSNWCYAYCFLSYCEYVSESILKELETGIINMTDYIANHYSRYSSANNHLIVEAYAIGQSGVLLNYKPWIDLAVQILTKEFPLQNYSDGVNKELSLHYQSFYMEAVGLMMRLLRKNNIVVPYEWSEWLGKMCHYLRDCLGEHGEVVEFGDNDEGKILDLCGEHYNHYEYVLGLLSCQLSENYIMVNNEYENLCWLFTEQDVKRANENRQYRPQGSVCYKEGGNSILRSDDGRILIGVDHAALGFGSIAAHGHADALSFQLYVDGMPIFVDPGTYIYHCDLESRNDFRRTKNHNTICIDGKDQSEMLGAFLWGRKAKCDLLQYTDNEEHILLSAQHNGYDGIKVKRTFDFDKENKLMIIDSIEGNCEGYGTLILHPDCRCRLVEPNIAEVLCGDRVIQISVDENLKFEMASGWFSSSYGNKIETNILRYLFKIENEKKIIAGIKIYK